MNKRKVKKWLLYSATLAAAYILQATIFNRFTICGVSLMLVTGAVTCAALFEGGDSGAAFGLAAGLLLAFTNTDKAMFYVVTLTVSGALAGGLGRYYLTQTPLSAALLCGGATLFCEGAIWLVGVAVSTLPLSAFITVVLPQALLAVLFSALFFIPDYFIHKV